MKVEVEPCLIKIRYKPNLIKIKTGLIKNGLRFSCNNYANFNNYQVKIEVKPILIKLRLNYD